MISTGMGYVSIGEVPNRVFPLWPLEINLKRVPAHTHTAVDAIWYSCFVVCGMSLDIANPCARRLPFPAEAKVMGMQLITVATCWFSAGSQQVSWE